MKSQSLCILSCLAPFFVNCGKKSSDDSSTATAYSASKPSAIVSVLNSGIKSVGSGLTTGSSLNLSSSSCDKYGYPSMTALPNGASDGRYPGYLTYCFLSVDSGDTVVGGFSTPKAVSCVQDMIAPIYDGVPHTFSVNATACFANQNAGVSTLSGTYTASAPASFNPAFDKGIIMDMTSTMGLKFQIASKVLGSKISFISEENWNPTSTTTQYGGASAGTLDTSTGDLQYESRSERINCQTSSSCGWNRHTRIYANLALDANGSPNGVNKVSFAYSNISATPGQNNFSGTLITADGALATGVKARYIGTSSSTIASVADYLNAAKWTETANTSCYSKTSESGTGCGAGIAPVLTGSTFSNGFTLTGSYTGYDKWITGLTTQSFNSVSPDADKQ